MNIFRVLGDISHLVAKAILIFALLTTKSTKGISFKTQILYLIVFVSRYMDFMIPGYRIVSIYNILLKILYIGSSVFTIVWMKHLNSRTANRANNDSFQIKYLLALSAIFGFLFNYGNYYSGPIERTAFEILWSFSLWLESVAILPQLFVLLTEGQDVILIFHYFLALGLYRAFYIPNWIWRYYYENRSDSLSFIAGVIQTLIYVVGYPILKYFNSRSTLDDVESFDSSSRNEYQDIESDNESQVQEEPRTDIIVPVKSVISITPENIRQEIYDKLNHDILLLFVKDSTEDISFYEQLAQDNEEDVIIFTSVNASDINSDLLVSRYQVSKFPTLFHFPIHRNTNKTGIFRLEQSIGQQDIVGLLVGSEVGQVKVNLDS